MHSARPNNESRDHRAYYKQQVLLLLLLLLLMMMIFNVRHGSRTSSVDSAV